MSTSPFFFKAFLGTNGRPAASGWLFAYVAGSNVPKAIYADRNNTIPRDNPLRLDGNGIAPQFFTEAGLYDFKVYEYNFVTPESPGPLCYTAEDIDGETGNGGGPAYILPVATETVLGGVKPDGVSALVDEGGVLSVPLPVVPPAYVLPVATEDTLGGIRPDGKSVRVGVTGLATAYPLFSVTDFGAKGDGATPDQDAINAAIAAAGSVVTQIVDDNGVKLNTVTSAVYFPSGSYLLTGPIKYLNGVSIFGASGASVEIIVDFAGYGIEPNAYNPDLSIQYADIHFRDLTFRNGPSHSGLGATKNQLMIRNCEIFNVRCFGFPRPFYYSDTWTNRLVQCSSYNSTGSHIYGDLRTGILQVIGGRFDECTGGGPGVYMNSLEGEITMRDCQVQFGNGAAVELNCPSVNLDGVFFEGNCIDNTGKYHVEAARQAAPNNQLSSFVMTNCVVNNRGQSRRDGLGIVRAANFKKVEYRERWVRNGVREVPLFPGCEIIDCTLSSASPRSEILASVGAGLQNHAVIRQVARPIGIFGQDMGSDGSYAPTVRAAANFGFDDKGLALGTYYGRGASQGYGTVGGRSNAHWLNPWGGDLLFGILGEDAKVLDGTNEFWGRFRSVQQLTSSDVEPAKRIGAVYVDCTAGGRTVTLLDDENPPENGRRIMIAKTDTTPNDLTIVHESALIDGQPSIALRMTGACVVLEGDGTGFNVVQSHLWFPPRLTVRTGTSTVASATRITRYTGTGGHEERLPAASVVCDERWYRNRGSGIWTLRCAGADFIDPGNSGAVATTLDILPGQNVHIYCPHNEFWEVL